MILKPGSIGLEWDSLGFWTGQCILMLFALFEEEKEWMYLSLQIYKYKKVRMFSKFFLFFKFPMLSMFFNPGLQDLSIARVIIAMRLEDLGCPRLLTSCRHFKLPAISLVDAIENSWLRILIGVKSWHRGRGSKDEVRVGVEVRQTLHPSRDLSRGLQ